MISIIICYNNNDLLSRITESISTTIGTPYELILIDNSSNTYSIFSAYNEGVRRSKFEILCFCHQDIIYYTKNWGENVLKHFQNKEVGMIGVTGGLALPIVPAAWWYNSYFAKEATNLLMPSKQKSDKKILHYKNDPFNQGIKTQATIIDGVWFCIRKSLFENISFDEKNFTGFHLYDADISMQVLKYSKAFIVFDILILHDWDGEINKEYYFDLKRFNDKWKDSLPKQVDGLNKNYVHMLGYASLRYLILDMKSKKIDPAYIKQIKNEYYPLLKKNYSSIWFRLYFNLSALLNFRIANSIFYRLERLSGFIKNTNHAVSFYTEP